MKQQWFTVIDVNFHLHNSTSNKFSVIDWHEESLSQTPAYSETRWLWSTVKSGRFARTWRYRLSDYIQYLGPLTQHNNNVPHSVRSTDQHTARRSELRSRWTTALEQSASQDSPAQRHRRISSAAEVVFVQLTPRHIVTTACSYVPVKYSHSLTHSHTPDLKLISFTNPFLHSHSYSFRTDFTDLNLYWIKGALLFVLVSGYVC